MKKKNQNRNVFFIIGILLVFIILGTFLVGQFQQTAYSSGMVIKSITAPNYVTSNPDLSNYNWRVSANIIGSEKIVYTLSPDDFESFSGLASVNDFTIEITSYDEFVNYAVVKEDTIPDYTYTYIKGAEYNPFDREPDACPSGASYQFVERNLYPHANVRHCLYQTRYGFKGVLNEPSVKFDANIKLSAQDLELSEDITSEDSVVSFEHNGEELAKAQWTGSLISGDPLPKTDNIVTILQDGKSWYLITEDAWTNYLIADNNFLDIWKSDIVDDEKNDADNIINYLQAKIDNYKNQRVTYLNQRTSIGGASWVSQSSITDAKLIYDVNARITIPEIVFDIRADWIGIKLQSGMPRIRTADCSDATSGEQNFVTLEVENIGQETGTFAFEKTGCDSFEQQFSSISERVTVEPNERKTIILELTTGALNDDVSERCSIRAYDVSDPNNEDAINVVCESKALEVCIPEQQRIQGLCIYECSNDGKYENVVKCCETSPVFDPITENYKCDDGKTEICNDGIDNDGDGNIDDDDSECGVVVCPAKELFGIPILPDFGCLIKNKFLFALQILGFIIILLVGIGSYYSQIALARKYKFKKNNVVFILISILLSIALYLLLFQFLLWIIGIGVIVLIIKFIGTNLFKRMLDKILPKK